MIKPLQKYLLCILFFGQACAAQVKVISEQVNAATSLQAVSWQGDSVLASGTQNSIYYSPNNGVDWQQLLSPDAEGLLQFRDNQQLATGRIMVMSAGEGAESGVFVSDNRGASWQRVSHGEQPSVFYDCFYMKDSLRGWLYGDSDDNGLFVLKTDNGGLDWHREPLPIAALKGEGGFASSGTCVNGYQNDGAVIGTGNAEKARLLLWNNNQWQVVTTPIGAGEAGGIFSVQPIGDVILIAGGSLNQPNQAAGAWLYKPSTPNPWQKLPEIPLQGAVYGSAVVNVGQTGSTILVSNPQGVAVLFQHAQAWQMISESNIWSLTCKKNTGCIGVGKGGVIERYLFESDPQK